MNGSPVKLGAWARYSEWRLRHPGIMAAIHFCHWAGLLCLATLIAQKRGLNIASVVLAITVLLSIFNFRRRN